jgi:hypothetical protein
MSDLRLTINGADYIVPGVAQEQPLIDAIAALQVILLALVAELRDRGALEPDMLAHRLKGAFPDDAEDSTVKGLVEVFGRRLEPREKPAEARRSPATNGHGEDVENSGTLAAPVMQFQSYGLVDRAAGPAEASQPAERPEARQDDAR